MTKRCVACNTHKSKREFSNKNWRKKFNNRCKSCCANIPTYEPTTSMLPQSFKNLVSILYICKDIEPEYGLYLTQLLDKEDHLRMCMSCTGFIDCCSNLPHAIRGLWTKNVVAWLRKAHAFVKQYRTFRFAVMVTLQDGKYSLTLQNHKMILTFENPNVLTLLATYDIDTELPVLLVEGDLKQAMFSFRYAGILVIDDSSPCNTAQCADHNSRVDIPSHRHLRPRFQRFFHMSLVQPDEITNCFYPNCPLPFGEYTCDCKDHPHYYCSASCQDLDMDRHFKLTATDLLPPGMRQWFEDKVASGWPDRDIPRIIRIGVVTVSFHGSAQSYWDRVHQCLLTYGELFNQAFDEKKDCKSRVPPPAQANSGSTEDDPPPLPAGYDLPSPFVEQVNSGHTEDTPPPLPVGYNPTPPVIEQIGIDTVDQVPSLAIEYQHPHPSRGDNEYWNSEPPPHYRDIHPGISSNSVLPTYQ